MKLYIRKYFDNLILLISFSFSIIIETLVQMELIQDSKITKLVQYIVLLVPIIARLFKIFVTDTRRKDCFLLNLIVL